MYILKSLLAVATSTTLAGCYQNIDSDKKKPNQKNVIIFLADDLGWANTSAYGSKYYKTPNLDSLQQQGVRFTQAYAAAAVCSPTRASLMTGLPPAQIGLTDFIPGDPFPYAKLKQPQWQKYLPLNEYTIAEAAKKYGYTTAIFGKWHISKEKKPPKSLSHNPDKQGFDHHIITYKPKPNHKPGADAHNTDIITQKSISFLNNQTKPFLLIMSYNAVHDPLMADSLLVAKFSTPDTNDPRNNPVLAAMLYKLDQSIGIIGKTLKKLNIDTNTVCIFYSDNGGKASLADQSPLKAGKGWLYEGGIRVPLIINVPQHKSKVKHCPQVASTPDVSATIMSVITGKDTTFGQGISLLPYAYNASTKTQPRTLYWHYPHYHNGTGMKPASAIRCGKYKLVQWHEPMLTNNGVYNELYDLEHDIAESNNLAPKMPYITDSLATKLNNWRKKVKAKMPEINPNFETSKANQALY